MLNRITYSFIVFLFGISVSNAQKTPTLNWAKVFGSLAYEEGYSLITDSDDNIIISGRFNTTTDFDPGPGITSPTVSAPSAFIAKYTSDGTFLWVKHFASTTSSYLSNLKLDKNDNIYSCGSFYENIDLDPGSGTNIITTPNYEALLVKLHPDGSIGYIYHSPVVSGKNSFNYLAVHSDGTVYASSFQSGIVDYDPGAGTHVIDNTLSDINNYIVKLDNTGNIAWVLECEEENDAISIDYEGNLLLSGMCYSDTNDIVPGPVVVNVSPSSSAFSISYVLKMDSAGNYLDHFLMETNDYLYTKNIHIDSYTGDILLSGIFNGYANFNMANTLDTYTTNSTEEVFVARYSSNGEIEWVRIIESTAGSSYISSDELHADINGNIYISGDFLGEYDIDTNTTINSANGDVFLLKLDSQGKTQWVYELINNGSINGIYTSADANYLYLAGGFETASNVDPAGTFNISPTGNSDIFLVKWNNCNIDTALIQNGNTLICSEQVAGTSYQWYDCSTGNPLQDEIMSTFIPALNGDYRVLISKGSCSAFSECISVTNVSITKKEDKNSISLYPNPVESTLTISGLEQGNSVKIMNMLGHIVFENSNAKEQEKIDLKHLAPGAYLVQITGSDFVASKHFIKK